MRADKLECYPEERRTYACQLDTLAGQPVYGPSKTANKNSPGNGDQKQEAPSARYREATMNGEYRRNPRHRRQDEKKSMKKSTPKRHERPGAKDGREENPDANPRIDTEMEAGVGERKRGSGCSSD